MSTPDNFYDYARYYKDYFYEWEEDGQVLAVKNGSTICYLDYLLEVLSFLSEHTVPSMGTLAMVLIATSPDVEDALPHVEQIMQLTHERLSADGSVLPNLHHAFEFLERLRALPVQYRKGKNRLMLLQLLFAEGHNFISGRRMRRILHQYRSSPAAGSELVLADKINFSTYADHIRPLVYLNEKFATVERILQKLVDVPELDDLPVELLEVQLSNRPEDFIETLTQNPDTYHIGTLIQRIWSGLSIPFHSIHPTIQPLGGVSDLSNKGTLDKLLISEYAHDDLLFLSRLANGEALYINREAPPETTRLKRILLIDSSLQTWGTPRTLAYALALAITRHPKTDIECIAFAIGKTQKQVYFSSIDELIHSLSVLDTSLHAAEGSIAILKELPASARHELFFLTSPEGLQQPAVQKMMSDYHQPFNYCITASEDASFTVYKKSGAGFKQLQSFSLPLDILWAKPPVKAKPPQASGKNDVLPAHYPIYFPHPVAIKKMMTTNDGHTFIVTNERALLRKGKISSTDMDKGWLYIIDDLPSGHCFYEMGKDANGHYLLLCYSMQAQLLHIYNISKGRHASILFDRKSVVHKYDEFLFWQDEFLLIGLDDCFVFARNTDATTQELTLKVKKVEGTKRSIIDAYHARQASLTARRFSHAVGQTLRKIKRVFIGKAGSLVINNHELKLMGNGSVRFTVSAALDACNARAVYKNKFQFTDGSSVAINRNGMVILQSSNQSIPIIYLPSVLDTPLGMATQDHYCGADFFCPEGISQNRILEPAKFYQLYLRSFISHIVTHAAKP